MIARVQQYECNNTNKQYKSATIRVQQQEQTIQECNNTSATTRTSNTWVMMMIAFITFKSSLVPLFEGLWSNNTSATTRTSNTWVQQYECNNKNKQYMSATIRVQQQEQAIHECNNTSATTRTSNTWVQQYECNNKNKQYMSATIRVQQQEQAIHECNNRNLSATTRTYVYPHTSCSTCVIPECNNTNQSYKHPTRRQSHSWKYTQVQG